MEFKKGEIVSRFSYMRIESIGNNIEVKNTKNINWNISKDIVKNECKSATFFEKEESVSRTRVCEILEESNGQVFTVKFTKQVDDKRVLKTLQELYPNKGKIVSKDDFDKSIKSIMKDVKEGEERILSGYLISTKQEFGRYKAIDLDIQFNNPNEHAVRQIDSKTISELIFNGVKYKVK